MLSDIQVKTLNVRSVTVHFPDLCPQGHSSVLFGIALRGSSGLVNMKLYELLKMSAISALDRQKNDGSMPAGHNGPYYHSQTPVRNTCHVLILFLKVYEFAKDEKFLIAAKKCIEYLIKEKKRYKYNYVHRNFEGKDKCNGLIGPAWTMEALIIASIQLKRKDLSDLANEIFSYHNFDEKRGLWYAREVDGENGPIDWTFNHQLWFAAAASMLDQGEYPEARDRVERFMKNLNKNFTIYKNGLIWHHVARIGLKSPEIRRFLQRVKGLTLHRWKNIHKAIGYHQFNLYAFAILKQNLPDDDFWNSRNFRKTLKFLENKKYKEGLCDNDYGFGYNVAGIEVAYALNVFKPGSDILQKYWLEEQFNRNYDFKERALSKDTKDPETLTTRIYEATRLNDMELDFFKVRELPMVSVVVPVYNDQHRIGTCLEGLLKQTYPGDKFEIIVVDNGSTDNTPDVAKKYPVELLFEKGRRSSYAARNKGVAASNGEIVAFIDSDSHPAETWLENGVRALLINNADLVAGKVSFIFKNHDDLYEAHDSITNMQQKRKVFENKQAATANLFSRKNVFDKIGFFPGKVASGGDIAWTGKATSNGLKLIYESSAESFHPTRNKEQLLSKQIRVGYGQIPVWLGNKSKAYILLRVLRGFLPPAKLRNNFRKDLPVWGFYMVRWRSSFHTSIGRLMFLRDRFLRRHKNI